MSIMARGSKMKKAWIFFLMAAFVSGFSQQQLTPQSEATAESLDRRAILVDVQGPIGPATVEFLVDSLQKAATRNAELMIIRLDTPGGLDASTRDIVKAILNSPVPVATYVAPEGARAASAGTYILYASHIAAMNPVSHVGAATPVSIIGGKPPGQGEPGRKEEPDGDEKDSETTTEPTDVMSRKAINDAVAWVRALATKRGRNADWAELAVREAASITAIEALEIGVIDLIAQDVGDL
jgi:membrane-bound serine protease (ClpP class)